jgi:hypothetical protein
MGKIGAGLGTFEMMGKTASFAPLYNGMAQIAAQLAKAKAEADKQRKKAEEEAMAKVDDFYAKKQNAFTQKYLPFAQQAYRDTINKIAEDKAKYPNTWTNRVSERMLQMESGMLWAAEQSKKQIEIEKSAQEGYIVPKELLQAYKTNYGDVSDIAALAPGLSDYNINVGPDGAISANLVKPVDLTDEFGKFKNNRALFLEPKLEFSQVTSPQGVKFDITKQVSSMDPASVDVFTKESMNNPSLRVSYLTDPNKRTQVNAIMQDLSSRPEYSQIPPDQIKQLAVSQAIQSDIEKYDKTRSQITSQREAKGLTVNVGQKPSIIDPDSVFFEEQSQFTSSTPVATFSQANQRTPSEKQNFDKIDKSIREKGSYKVTQNGETFVYKKDSAGNIKKYKVESGTIYGFDARQVWEKQSDKEQFKSVPTTMISNKKLYSPDTKEPLGESRQNQIVSTFPGGLISSYLYINGKVYASVTYDLPSSRGVGIADTNSFLVEVTKGDNFDVLGRNLASSQKKKYNSMYDYFRGKTTGQGQTQSTTTTYSANSLN